MGKAVGIDLGTTNSVVAVMEGGQPTVIANTEGARTTPSVVAISKGGERLVGQLARRQAVVNPQNTVYSIKRFMGRHYSEVASELQNISYKVKEGPEGGCKVVLGGKDYSPEEISAMILRKLKEDAEKYLGEKVTGAVITVPAYFNDSQRQATKNAGQIAGLEVLRIINEPTAAALAYGLERKKNETILVFDLGGGTFDVSVLEVGDGLFEVKSTSGDTHLGGDDFDHMVVEWLATEFKSAEGIDLRKDPQALQRLMEAAEKAKIELSSVTETTISLPFVTANETGPKHLDMKLTRARFNDLTRDLVQRCKKPVEQALADAKLTYDQIEEVVLVGGSTRIPAVKDLVKSLTGGKEPNQSVNPDEVVAIGAAVQAGVLAGEVKEIVLLDVTPLSLGIETMGGVFTKLVEKNTTIPTHKSQVFSTAEDNQPNVDVQVFQGERAMARDNKMLGNFILDGIAPGRRGQAKIEVSFDIDANGIVSVTAKDQTTGKEQKITITATTNLTKEDIDRMVKEAESHVKEDELFKEKAEMRNDADALTYAVEKHIAENGSANSDENKEKATKLIADVRQKVKDNVDNDSLKKAIEELRNLFVAIQQEAEAKNREPVGATAGGSSAGSSASGGQGSSSSSSSSSSSGSGSSSSSGDDVVDAEVV